MWIRTKIPVDALQYFELCASFKNLGIHGWSVAVAGTLKNIMEAPKTKIVVAVWPSSLLAKTGLWIRIDSIRI
jgi:hypothetical protein